MSAKILVVEDDEDSRYTVSLLLEMSNYKVKTAANGVEAINLVDEFTPDVILSDLQMPIMDGRKFLSKIKSRNETASIPVILITATPDVKVDDVFSMLTKPVDFDELKRIITAAIQQRL